MTILFLAFALAMDSVALSLVNGANRRNLGFLNIFKMAFVFGFFQALMPLIGYFLGLSFVEFIASIDHFIAFFILLFLGAKMIKESKNEQEDTCDLTLGVKELILGAIATSIDALAVGITFSFENIEIYNACAVIGIVCFVLCIMAYYVGKTLGKILEKKALALGGVILIAIGFKILIQHLLSHG